MLGRIKHSPNNSKRITFYILIALLFVAVPASAAESPVETETETIERVYMAHGSAHREIKSGNPEIEFSAPFSLSVPNITPLFSEKLTSEKLFILFCSFKYYD